MSVNGYALDMVSPVRHIATELKKARPQPLTIAELVAGYTHPNSSDLFRVCQHEVPTTKREAETWLIQQAVTALDRARQVETVNGGYRLAVPFDQLRYEGRPVTANVNEHELFRDAFNPMSGRWSEDARRRGNLDLDELRESMREFGWVEQFPAIVDERGVVLVGHRRLAVAKELGIEPVIAPPVVLGRGDAADAQRFRLAIASNIGSKPFTKEERKDLAEYLYGERNWTIVQIAKALDIGKSTIARDLEHDHLEFSHDGKTPGDHAAEPVGGSTGRPRGSTKKPRQGPTTPRPGSQYAKIVAYLTEHGPGTLEDIVAGTGFTDRQASSAMSYGISKAHLFVTVGKQRSSKGRPIDIFDLAGTDVADQPTTEAETQPVEAAPAKAKGARRSKKIEDENLCSGQLRCELCGQQVQSVPHRARSLTLVNGGRGG